MRFYPEFRAVWPGLLFVLSFLCALSGSPMPAQESAAHAPAAKPGPTLVTENYGQTADGQTVRRWICTNPNGYRMELLEYGATLSGFFAPDRNGTVKNVVLTCPDLAGFQACKSYFGCIAGRYCNRIAGGKFVLNGQTFQLAVNNGPNHLHGGLVGFDKRVWSSEAIREPHAVGVRFRLRSPNGEEGYPGTVNATAEYRLTHQNELVMDLLATTDAPTHVNLTNHAYWNLAGEGTILDHLLTLPSEQYLPVDETLIPTGELASVAETPLDFRQPTAIGARIDALRGSAAKGYDHCVVVKPSGERMALAATLADPKTGRVMEIWTDRPGLQFYSGNFLDGTPESAGYPVNSACCLETQYFPDTPNQPNFPSSLLQPNGTYHSRTVHKFRSE